MVTSALDHGMQADVVFIIESTASNGAYLNEFKTNYIIPTLEYFSQGGIEDREFASETSLTLYGIVQFNASDALPSPISYAYGPFSNPRKVLQIIEKTEMIGGRGESHAHIAEGISTALHCFEDLQLRREPNIASQKHCILFCNSPPYSIGVQESNNHAGYTLEKLASLFQERNINLSILSPRKISCLFKLFEKAGGDLQSSQTKNYAKDSRHLVLLRNYSLKESPISPTSAATAAAVAAAAAAVAAGPPNPAQMALSPLQNDSPNPNQIVPQTCAQTQAVNNQQTPNQFRPQNPQALQQAQAAAAAAARAQYNPQIGGPPNYPRPPHPGTRWIRPSFMGPGQAGPGGGPPPPPASANQGSALIAQLQQPPSSIGINVQPFTQRMEAPNPGMNPNQQAQQQQQLNQQLNQQQQQQIRLNMQLQQQQQLNQQLNQQQQQQPQQQQQNTVQQQQLNAQQAQMGMQQQPPQSQAGPQLNVSGVNASLASQMPQTVTSSQGPQVTSVPSQMTQNMQQGQPISGNQNIMNADRTIIWKGMLEWVEKSKNMNDAQKQTWQVPCQVSSVTKDGEPEIKAESWPMKLIMQLMPKMLIGNIGNAYLKNSKSVVFFPSACEALESLIKVMSNGFAGCVHFTQTPACNIKVLLLLYTAEKRSFIGFIPNDQQAFVDRLRKVIQQQKSSQAMIRQGPVTLRPQGPGTGPGGPGPNVMAGGVPNSGISQGGIMMSQTNTMTMGGGQIMSNNGMPQQPLVPTTGQQQGQLNIQSVAMSGGGGGPQGQMNTGGNNMMGQQQQQQQQQQNHQLNIARQQNLLNIHHLQQTLEAAQQQEAQYKSQMDVNNIQQNLDHAQAQEMQFKQMEQAQQAQRAGMNVGPGLAGPVQNNPQRMLRPTVNNTIGLRHLLQQQQTQYRPVLGMQQQMVGPRGQMAPRPMAPGNPQNQQFDPNEVPNYDFLG